MSSDERQRTAQSVRDRLRRVATDRNDVFESVLIRYAIERLLWRLSKSVYREELILKGAMLFQVWDANPHRATRDLDLLAEGDVGHEAILDRVRTICSIDAEEDGLEFDVANLLAQDIRDENRYGGVRVRFRANLGSARIPIQVDFGIGDAVTPAPVLTAYPSRIGMATPVILAYPRATVIAEKLEAIVDFGMDNSRMKDYFDLWFIVTTFQDDPREIAEAVRRTFGRRDQPLPREVPIGLSEEFASDLKKRGQWRAFLGRTGGGTVSLTEVVTGIREFAMPVFSLARQAS